MVGARHHFRVPQQGPLTDLIFGCSLDIPSESTVLKAQMLFNPTLAGCPSESDFQVFGFPIGTQPSEAIGLLLAAHYAPSQPPELFGWEFYFRRFVRRVSWNTIDPYLMLSVGSPRRASDGYNYIPLILDNGDGRHRFNIEPFTPWLPYVPEILNVPKVPKYYILARCSDMPTETRSADVV